MAWQIAIPVVIFAASLLGAAAIIARRLPQLSQLQIDRSGALHQAVKQRLLQERLRRKFGGLRRAAFGFIGPVWRTFARLVQRLPQRLRELEQRHRSQLNSRLPKGEQDRRIKLLLIEAGELIGQDQLSGAERRYLEVLGYDQFSFEAYRGLATIYRQRKEYDLARQTLQHLLKLNSQDDSVYGDLGEIAWERGNLREAEESFLHSISLNSEAARYHLELSAVYQALGELDKAFEQANRAAEIEPASPKHLDQLIEISILRGDRSAAAMALQRLRQANPDNGKIAEWEGRLAALTD